MRRNAQFHRGIKSLLLAIHDAPGPSVPKLGSRFTRTGPVKSRRLRLPIMELDGWRLISGVAMNQEHPTTFQLPSEKARLNVKKGDLVKLIFEIAVPHSDEFGGLSAERMWVKVKERKGPYFTGNLANQPLSYDEADTLKLHDQVAFLPEHIIDIDPGGKWDAGETNQQSKHKKKQPRIR
jgi:hypothetical protein